MAVQGGTPVARRETRPPRWGHRAGVDTATVATRIAIPAGLVLMIAVTILVTIVGTALAKPSQDRAAAPVADASSTANVPRPRLPAAAAFARSEALARRLVGSICAGCATDPGSRVRPARATTGSARVGGLTGYRAEAAHERRVVPR